MLRICLPATAIKQLNYPRYVPSQKATSCWLTPCVIIHFTLELMPVSGNIVYHLCRHNRVTDGRMCFPGPAQSGLTDSAGKRNSTVTVGGSVIPRSEPHGAVHRQSIQPAGGVVVRGCCPLQDPRIKISIENNQRAPADMVLQLRRNIGLGWCPEQFIVTDTVYSRRSRIDADSGFQSGLKYLLTQGIHQTDFQRLRAGIKPGRFSIKEERLLNKPEMRQPGAPAALTFHPCLQARTSTGLLLFFCLRTFRLHRDAVSQPVNAIFTPVSIFIPPDRFRSGGWLQPELIPEPPSGVAFILRPGRFITGV